MEVMKLWGCLSCLEEEPLLRKSVALDGILIPPPPSSPDVLGAPLACQPCSGAGSRGPGDGGPVLRRPQPVGRRMAQLRTVSVLLHGRKGLWTT